MAVVRKFVHLLDHSDQDFQEELDLMRLREEVITNIRSNQQLENDLNLMDIKIGLLVKNKITLQEVVSHSKKLTKKNKGELSNLMMMNKQKGGLKALSKEKREKLEAYQFLFYLLQVNLINSNPRIVWLINVTAVLFISLSVFLRQIQPIWPSWSFRCHRTSLPSSWILSFSHCTTTLPISVRSTSCSISSKRPCRRKSSRNCMIFHVLYSL